MKEFLRRLSLPAKLVLIGVLPMLFLLVVAFEFNKEKDDKLQMVDNYRTRIRQATYINELISRLQAERRYSFSYNLSGAWENRMLQQRSQTDDLINTIEKEASKELSGFQSYTFLSQLQTFRDRLDKHEVAPLEVMNYYTNAIFRLNTLNGVSSGNNIYLKDVIKPVTGQKLLSDIITYKGMILAQIYYMLETKKADAQLLGSVIQLQDIINSYLKEFALKAPPEMERQLEALKNDFDVKEATRIETAIRETSLLDTTIASDYWWNVATKAVDKHKGLQQQMMEQSRVGADEIYAKEKKAQIVAVIILLAVIILVLSLIFLVIRIITEALAELRNAAGLIAEGKTGVKLKPESNDAIGSLTESILKIDRNNNQLATAARAIGEGRFDVAVQPRSSEDVLGNAVVQMKQDLSSFRKSNEEKLWTQTGVALVNDSLRGDKDIRAISQDTLTTLVEYLQCEAGLFYSAGEERLHLTAGYAMDKGAVPEQLSFGETLVGEAAKRREVIQLHDVPEQFLKIRSGLGTASPRSLLIVPLCTDERVQGVIEVASLHPIEAYQMQFVKEIASDIAISLQAAKSKQRLQELFEETQAQSEELQSQHSELENINAELEAQAEKLQASEEELRVQQEELQQANQELEERSRLLEERNEMILERNLEIQSKAEELEISTKYKSEFLANMSHELRTPLNSILLLSRLLSENHESNLSSDQVEYANVIQNSGKGLLTLIDEILDLSKIEAGKMELDYSDVSLEGLTSEIHSLFAPLAKDKGISFAIETAENLPGILETDKLRLEQILRNLLSNALKFTKRGSVTLKIAKQDKALSFAVIDTGIGIPKDKQKTIFEAFQQADGSTRRQFGGTGLGLSISRELARLLGGEIQLKSEEGKGSEFTLVVPIHKGQTIAKPEPAPVLPEATPGPQPDELPARSNKSKEFISQLIPEAIPDDRDSIGANEKSILIIEDDTAFAKIILDYTRKKGYKGVVAVRGDEGIELARRLKPVGILLDIQLPVKSGWEVMDELKGDSTTRHIPVHMMSSLEAKNKSLSKGAVDFINKPVAFEQLGDVFKKIEQALTRHPKKVLIVEENPKHAKALAFFLENYNVATEVKDSVGEGVKALNREEVDCVILDMGVPAHHSYELLEDVKKTPGFENLPIIIFTGKNLSHVEERKIKQYADSIVIKTAQSYQRILDEVSLFLHLVEEHKKSNGSQKSRKLGGLDEVLRGKTILVVDDDVRNIFSLTKSLENHGVNVVSAIDGKDALKQLNEAESIDLVLMDMMMPEMDGYESTRQIRSNVKYRNLPVIAVTAKAMTGDREKCINAGASDYITKPVDIDQLLSLLRVWLYD